MRFFLGHEQLLQPTGPSLPCQENSKGAPMGAPYRKSARLENFESVRKNHTHRATPLFCSRINPHHVPPQPHRLNAIPARRLHPDLHLRLQPRQVFQRNQRSLQGNISHNGFFLEILAAFGYSADFRVELRFTPPGRSRPWHVLPHAVSRRSERHHHAFARREHRIELFSRPPQDRIHHATPRITVLISYHPAPLPPLPHHLA